MQTMWLLGGFGLGVGLMSLLAPEQGAERRDTVRGFVDDYGHQTADVFADTRRTLDRQGQAALVRTRGPFRRQPGLGERLQTEAAGRGLSRGLCLLGGVGLGVGLGYFLDRQEGPQRRARLREKARAYWRTTDTSHAPQQELRRAWRFYQGRDTQRVNAHTRKPAQAEAWYAEPGDYEGIVLYSEPFLTRDEAEAWAKAQDKQ